MSKNGKNSSLIFVYNGQISVVFFVASGIVLAVNSQNSEPVLTEDDKIPSLAVSSKRGDPIYERNPSIPEPGTISRNRKRQLGDERKGLVINEGSGEILGQGTALAYEWEEVDAERFVKLFLNGLKQASGLSKAGMLVFEVVYNQIRQNPNNDKIELSYYSAEKVSKGLVDRTYRRGLRELLDKEFLYRSPFDGVFFVNIRYMFNGDRLAFVKAYHLKDAGPSKQQQLDLLPPDN